MFLSLFITFEHKNLHNKKNLITLKKKHKTFYAFPKKKATSLLLSKSKTNARHHFLKCNEKVLQIANTNPL
jgi:hypothetical protein